MSADRMSVAPIAPIPFARRRTGDALLDGAIAGTVAAVIVVLWVMADDLARQLRIPDMWTPAGAIERMVATPGARPAWVGLAAQVLAYVALGAAVPWLVTRVRRTPAAGLTLAASFAALIGIYALDGLSGVELFARMGPWSVVAVNAVAAVAMTLVLMAREPRLCEGRRDLWDDEP